MAFNRVNMASQSSAEALRSRLVTAANYEPERSMSNRRLTGTFFSLILGLATIYAAIFYAPAYFPNAQKLGFSTQNIKLPNPHEEESFLKTLAPYAKLFKVRRGYVKPGQALKIDYVLSPGTYMTVHVKKCNAPIFIEVMHCMNTDEQSIEIRNSQKGARSFVMSRPGFYYFDEFVMNIDGTPSEKPHKVTWSRKNMAQKKGVADATPFVGTPSKAVPLKLRGSSH